MTIVTRGQGQTDEQKDRQMDRPTEIATYSAAIAARNKRIMIFETRGYRMPLYTILLCKSILPKLVVTDRYTQQHC